METNFIWKGNTFTYDTSSGCITLKSGATVSATVNDTYKKHTSPILIGLREQNVDATTGTTINDTSFKSLSACASYIVGGSKSGNEYFKGCPELASVITTTTRAKATTTSETSHDVDAQQAQDTKSETDQKEKTTSSLLERKKEVNAIVKQFIYFCKDFSYNPDVRLLNSLYHQKDERQFLLDTLKLIGHDEDMIEIATEKTKSTEFKNLMKQIKSCEQTRDKMNKRLEIKFGKAGTGKTTSALKENPTALRIIASATDDPSDLFTTFNPTTKEWEKTPLSNEMEKGGTVIIDEANFYHQEVLKRLQGITDETSKFTDRGIDINIKDGFKIVITMNLETNFGKKPLPSPLVDRASKIECYDELQDLSWVW
jgi:hypothetical protein